MVVETRNLKRLTLAASASFCLLLATIAFSIMTKNNSGHEDGRAPVAKLTTLLREASSRSSDDVIWHNVEINEFLYNGDYVRTGAGSSATIEFLKQKALLNVDQNSVILIEESDGNPGVNFIDGSLIVDSKDGGKSTISVKAGGEKINLADSSISLNKGKKGDIDLTLVSGNLDSLKQNNDSKILNSLDKKIRALEPLPNQTVFRTETETTNLTFKLAPDQGLISPVTLQLGDSADSLRNITSVEPGVATIRIPLSAGVHFWKLVSGDRESAVIKVKIQNLVAARPLFPANQSVLVPNQKGNLAFSWAVDPNWSKVNLELSETANFSKLLSQTDVTGKDSVEIPVSVEQRLFWRLSTFIDANRASFSDTYSFTVGHRAQEHLSMDLLRPYDNENFQASAIEASGLILSWKSLDADIHYQVNLKNLKGGSAQNFKSPINHWRLPSLETGKYQWTVTALDAQEKEVGTSEIRTFEVEELSNILFKNLRSEIYYTTDRPTMALDWENGSSEAKEWHVKITLQNENGKKDSAGLSVLNFSTTTTSLVKTLPFPGLYTIEVEAANLNGEIVAKSEKASVLFKQAALIAAPTLDARVPASIKADNRGGFDLAWKPVHAAQEYIVRLKSDQGTVLDTQRISATAAQFRKLKPGAYSVTVRAVDSEGHEGIETQPRSVFVDQISYVEPPKHRKVSFDDE